MQVDQRSLTEVLKENIELLKNNGFDSGLVIRRILDETKSIKKPPSPN